jgi:hypothetical protein
MPPITKFKGKQIKENEISDQLIGTRTVGTPVPTDEDLGSQTSLLGFMQWVVNRMEYLKTALGVGDAPNDGKKYIRKNHTWQEITSIEEITIINGKPKI